MEDFSSFINEEIFLISDQDSSAAKKMVEKKVEKKFGSSVKIGVLTEAIGETEKALLDKILGAISMTSEHILVQNEIDFDIPSWIVFSDSLSLLENDIEHFSKTEINGVQIITSTSLSSLQNSVEDKGRLWNLLKQVFKS